MILAMKTGLKHVKISFMFKGICLLWGSLFFLVTMSWAQGAPSPSVVNAQNQEAPRQTHLLTVENQYLLTFYGLQSFMEFEKAKKILLKHLPVGSIFVEKVMKHQEYLVELRVSMVEKDVKKILSRLKFKTLNNPSFRLEIQ